MFCVRFVRYTWEICDLRLMNALVLGSRLSRLPSNPPAFAAVVVQWAAVVVVGVVLDELEREHLHAAGRPHHRRRSDR